MLLLLVLNELAKSTRSTPISVGVFHEFKSLVPICKTMCLGFFSLIIGLMSSFMQDVCPPEN